MLPGLNALSLFTDQTQVWMLVMLSEVRMLCAGCLLQDWSCDSVEATEKDSGMEAQSGAGGWYFHHFENDSPLGSYPTASKPTANIQGLHWP